MAAYVHDSSFFSRRALVFLVIVGFHVVLAYALASGLARKVVEVIAPPIQTEIVEEIETRDEPPPPPPPEFERPPVEVPPPEVAIDIPIDTARNTAITDVTDKPVPKAPPPPPPPPVKRVPPRLDVRRSPPTSDYYPPTSRRMGEEGVTTVLACVGSNGRTSKATVEKTSGSSRLDEAAVRWAERARWDAGTENGKPVDMCAQFNVRFQLTD